MPAIYFFLGLIAGISICCFLFVVIVATKAPLMVTTAANISREAVKNLDSKMGNIFPLERGSIYIPPDDDEVARQEVIEENQAQGRDTKLSDLS